MTANATEHTPWVPGPTLARVRAVRKCQQGSAPSRPQPPLPRSRGKGVAMAAGPIP